MKKPFLANNIVISSGFIFILLFLGFFIYFSTLELSGDAAGKGMEAGLTLIFGVGFLFIIALILSIINLFLIKKITSNWVKYFAFLPISLTVITFLFFFMDVGKNEPSIDEQSHRLTCEIRSSETLKNGEYFIRTSKGSQAGRMKNPKKEGDNYIYTISSAIFIENERKVKIDGANFESSFYIFNIPEIPKPIVFSEWTSLKIIQTDSLEKIKIELRYKVEK
jgi:hypothetical protein